MGIRFTVYPVLRLVHGVKIIRDLLSITVLIVLYPFCSNGIENQALIGESGKRNLKNHMTKATNKPRDIYDMLTRMCRSVRLR